MMMSSLPSFQLKTPVFFVGFMGAGKTSVSRRLARMCRIASIDMDTYLERQEDRKISEIFANDGEEAFRTLESQLLDDLSKRDPLVVSCGGGIVLKKENRDLMRERGFVVYLEVSADEAADRISDASTRPMFKDLDNARSVIEMRRPLYEEVADLVIDTSGKHVGQIAAEVKEALRKKEILWQVPK